MRLVVAGVCLLCGATAAGAADVADLIVVDAKIYTAGPDHRIAQAMGVRDGKIIYVGDSAGAEALRGPDTVVRDAKGRLVLPGLVDAHIHPLGIVEVDSCDLGNRTVTLAELSSFVRDCIDRFHVPPGQWLTVEEWNFSSGNSPDPAHPTLRAALDLASRSHPIQLRGNDGHHGAFNSTALARAMDDAGHPIGFTLASLATTFASDRVWVGVDVHGEPDGTVNDEARKRLGLPASPRFAQLMRAPGRVVDALVSRGILTIQDAAARADNFELYESLLAAGRLTVRVNAAQYFPPEDFRTPAGGLDVQRAVERALARRRRYEGHPLIRAEAVKIFVDGVLEGNPLADPPTPPNAARLVPYLRPRFARDPDGALRVTGYDDAASSGDGARGALLLPHEELLAWAAGFHEAGFALHFHAIGEGAVHEALDAVRYARDRDHIDTQADTIAHAQLVDPADLARLGRYHLFVAYTFAWFYTDPEYDMSVIPFIDRVSGRDAAALHRPEFYYERNAYAARSVRNAGAVLIAGSDAPVDTRDPRPFVNMELALTRRLPGRPPLNPAEGLSITDVLDAYTINGARALGRSAETGSLEAGKSADFILVDQDVLSLAAAGAAGRIGQTRVIGAWFQGHPVFPLHGGLH